MINSDDDDHIINATGMEANKKMWSPHVGFSCHGPFNLR